MSPISPFSIYSPSAPSLSTLSPSSPSPPFPLLYPAANQKLPLIIVALLQKRVIPEAEALISTGHKDDEAVFGVRASVVRVVLSILCLCLDPIEGLKILGSSTQKDDVFGGFSPRAAHGTIDMKELVKWAVELLCQWYKAGDDLPWKTVLEKTLPQVVS